MSILSQEEVINNYNKIAKKEDFWLINFKDLYQNKNYLKFYPKFDTSRAEQLNAITRLCIYYIILILIFNRSHEWFYLPITVIVLVVIFYSIYNSDNLSKQKELDKILNIRKIKRDLRRAEILRQYKHDGSKIENDLLTFDDTKYLDDNNNDKFLQNYNLESGYIDFEGNLQTGRKYGPHSKDEEKPLYTVEELEQYRKASCRKPTKDNPFMNPDITDYNTGDVPAACNAYDEDIQDKSKVFFNHDLFRDVDELWEKKNSQRQFYTIPNTRIPNSQVDFAKWLYSGIPNCKIDGNCYRFEDLRQKR